RPATATPAPAAARRPAARRVGGAATGAAAGPAGTGGTGRPATRGRGLGAGAPPGGTTPGRRGCAVVQELVERGAAGARARAAGPPGCGGTPRRSAAADVEHPVQVVPRAGRAHLDDVARHLRAAAGELGHLPGRADAPPAGREPGPERVGDEGERLLLADRARLVDDPADPPGRPALIGVGVADVDPRQAALAVLAHDRLARQPV